MEPAQASWPLDALQGLGGPWLPGLQVQVVRQIDSTNSELMRRLRAGDERATLLVAETQSAGRGRMGRSWHDDGAPPAQAMPATLMFSLACALQPADWSGLSLAVGVAIAGSLHPDIGLKWPNDLWWRQRKLGGILIETAQLGARRHVVVGVGINIRQPRAAGLSTAPAWTEELLPGADAAAVLLRVAPAVAQALARFEREGFPAFRAEFAARDVLLGRALVLSDGSQGEGRGVDGGGALLVHTSLGMKTVISQEVSVRPAADGAADGRPGSGA